MSEPARFLTLGDEMAGRAAEDRGYAALTLLAAHAAREALVHRLGGEGIQSFNYRARFLPKWHDLCERTSGGSSRRPLTSSGSTRFETPSWAPTASRNAWTVAPRRRRPKSRPAGSGRRKPGGRWRRPEALSSSSTRQPTASSPS